VSGSVSTPSQEAPVPLVAVVEAPRPVPDSHVVLAVAMYCRRMVARQHAPLARLRGGSRLPRAERSSAPRAPEAAHHHAPRGVEPPGRPRDRRRTSLP